MKRIALILTAAIMIGSCSNDGFESEIKAESHKKIFCFVEAKDKCSEMSEATCDKIGGEKALNCEGSRPEITEGDYETPDFTCEWTPKKIIYGDSAALSFKLENADPNCEAKAFYNALDVPLDSSIAIKFREGGNLIVRGSLICKDEEKEGSRSKDCDILEIKPVPAPEIEGELVLNIDHAEASKNYYYIGAAVSIDGSSIAIANASDARCGDVEYELSGSADKAGNEIKAVATVICNGYETVLAEVIATVVPDPELGDCVLDSTQMIYDVMREGQTLKASAKVSNSYGRCGEAQYSFDDGETYAAGNSLLLEERHVGQLMVKAKVDCAGKEDVKSCPALPVAYYVNKEGGCYDNDSSSFNIKEGITFFEFACEEPKDLESIWGSYYIRCNGARGNFSIITENEATQNGGDNGWNFYPGMEAVEDGGLYRYPVPSLIIAKEDISCRIW